MAFCREWTEYGFRIRGVAHDDASHDLGDCGDDFVVTMLGNEYPRERRADLPRVVDARGHEAREKSLEVDVVGDNAGRFTAELESDAGDALGAEAHDSSAGSCASGESDLVDVVMADEMFADVDNSMRIAQEEIFGPVLCVIPFEDADDAIRISNDSIYGLSGAVYADDLDLAARIAYGVRTGQMWVNRWGMCITQPFGGFKQSGLGREGGIEGMAAYLEPKLIEGLEGA